MQKSKKFIIIILNYNKKKRKKKELPTFFSIFSNKSLNP